MQELGSSNVNQWVGVMGEEFDVRYYFTWDIESLSTKVMQNVSIHKNPTDMMTKTILVGKFRHCLDLVGACNTQWCHMRIFWQDSVIIWLFFFLDKENSSQDEHLLIRFDYRNILYIF